jgi:lycopene cyclase domain-containing protein
VQHLIYLAVLLACLLATAPLELLLGVRVYRRPRRWLLAVLPVALVFVLWDLYAVHRHQWWYDGGQVLGWWLPGRLPVEEVAFFLVVPTCAILALEAVRAVTGWRAGDEAARE